MNDSATPEKDTGSNDWQKRALAAEKRSSDNQRYITELKQELAKAKLPSSEEELKKLSSEKPEFIDLVKRIALESDFEMEEKFNSREKEITEKLSSLEKELKFKLQASEFLSKYPEANTLVKDQDFLDWLGKQSRIIQQGWNDGEFSDQEEVLNRYKNHQKQQQSASENKEEQVNASLDVETPAAKAPDDNGGKVSEKVFLDELRQKGKLSEESLQRMIKLKKEGRLIA